MSITIQIADKTAVLADGEWRSSEPELSALLNDHLATLQIPAHYPPQDKERLAAAAAVRDFVGKVIRNNPDPDGTLKVY